MTAVPPTLLSAQVGTVVGVVTDAQSGAMLAGSEVILEGTSLRGLSGDDGRFVLRAVPAGNRVLRVERIGYRSVRRAVIVSQGATLPLEIALVPEPVPLEGIVVTDAAGRRRLREVGNAVTQLDPDDVTERPATVSDFLQGAAVGVEVTGGSGEAGQGKQIRLRGNGSMVLSNQPLVYIDGVRMMEGAFPAEVFDRPVVSLPSGANVTTSPLDLVSVGDIDRIEVVKGPAATTLFGTGSSNGVIQIFTKRGVTGPMRLTAETSQGTGWVRPFGINGVEYLHVEHFLRDAWWGGGYEGGAASRDCVTDDPRWEGVNGSAEGGCSWPGAQWYQTYRLAVDGGTRAVDYFVSAEYQDDTYALPLDRLERYAARANLGIAVSPRVEARVQAAYSSFWTSNTASGRSAEGILLSTLRQERNYLSSADPRDIVTLLDNRNDQWVDRLTVGLGLTFGQSLRASHNLALGYDYSHQNLRSSHIRGVVFPPDAAVTTRSWDRSLQTVDYRGSYRFAPGRDLLSTLSFGAQLISDDLGWTVRSGVGYVGDVPTTPEEGETVGTLVTTGGTTTAGLFAQNVLALRDRYFLTAGVRLDRHETSEETFLGLDPRLGLTWVTSDEAFWPESLGAMRLRSAWGRSSTAPDPFLQALQYLGGAAPADAPPAALLEPEENSEWEVGFDTAWLGERLTVGFTRYVQTTSNAIVPFIEDTGALPQRRELLNVGKIRNQGIELQVDAALLDAARWALEVGLGITTNHSKVLDLGGADSFQDLDARLILGYPVPVSNGHLVADPDAVNGPWTSDRYVTDADGNQFFPLGAQLPTRFVSPSLSARIPGGVLLSARGEYRGGNVRFVNPVPVGRGVRSPLCFPYYVDPETSVALRPDTPDLWRERCTPQAASVYWYDGDYFKLRTVAASVPVGFLMPDRVDDALLTVTLSNAWTWYADVPWWDLEILGNDGANEDGLNSSDRVPAPTTLTFSLRVVF